MKAVLRFSILAAAILLSAPVLQAQNPDSEKELQKIQGYIDEVTRDIRNIDLYINQRTIEKYIEKAEQGDVVIPVFAIKWMDWDQLFDTVPHLKRLHNDFEKAEAELKAILEQDREYIKAINRVKAGENSSDLNKSKARIFARLSKENEDYKYARTVRDRYLKKQNIALVRFLLEYFQSKGEIFPTKGLITDDELWSITRTPEIANLVSDQRILNSALYELKRKYTNLKYGIE